MAAGLSLSAFTESAIHSFFLSHILVVVGFSNSESMLLQQLDASAESSASTFQPENMCNPKIVLVLLTDSVFSP